MLLGLLPALHQALHSRLLLRPSFHTNSRAAANGTMELRLAARLAVRRTLEYPSRSCTGLAVRLAVRTLEYPSQSCSEIQPASRYITCGQPGMLEGRCSELLHALHSRLLLNFRVLTAARAASNGRKARLPRPPRPFAGLALVPPSKAPRSAVGCVPCACVMRHCRTTLLPRVSSRASWLRSSSSTSVSEHMRSAWLNMGSAGHTTRRPRGSHEE